MTGGTKHGRKMELIAVSQSSSFSFFFVSLNEYCSIATCHICSVTWFSNSKWKRFQSLYFYSKVKIVDNIILKWKWTLKNIYNSDLKCKDSQARRSSNFVHLSTIIFIHLIFFLLCISISNGNVCLQENGR